MKFNKKIWSAISLVLFLNVSVYSQDQASSPKEPLAEVISEIEELLNNYKKQLKENDNEILKNQITIKKSQILHQEAQKSNNIPAGTVSKQAEQTAQEALLKNNANKTKINALIDKLESIKVYTKEAVSIFKTNISVKAKPVSCSGDVIVSTNTGTKSACTTPITLTSGDVIKTGNASSVLLVLNDGSIVKVCENTEFKIPNDKAALDIAYGRLRSWVKKFSRKFEVRTPSAVTSVRGTNFETNYTKENGFELTLYEGEVEIENTLTKEKILLKSGQKLNIDAKGKTIGPVEFENKDIKQWWEE